MIKFCITEPDAVIEQVEQTEEDNLQPTVDFITAIYNTPGLSIPILETPEIVAQKLLLGQNTDLLIYDFPDADFDVNFDVTEIGLDALLPDWGLNAVLEFDLGLTSNLYFAYDTYGLAQWKELGFSDDNSIRTLNGFYLRDVNEDGVDTNELQGRFGVGIGFENNLIVAKAKMTGGVQSDGNIKVEFIDNGEDTGTNDGVIRFLEVVKNDFSGLQEDSEVGVEVSGEIEGFLNAEEINGKILSQLPTLPLLEHLKDNIDINQIFAVVSQLLAQVNTELKHIAQNSSSDILLSNIAQLKEKYYIELPAIITEIGDGEKTIIQTQEIEDILLTENQIYTQDLSSNFIDISINDQITYSAQNLPNGLTLSDAGVLQGTVGNSTKGDYNVTLIATDSEGENLMTEIFLSVTDPTDPTDPNEPENIELGNDGGDFDLSDRTNNLNIQGGDGDDNITSGSGNDRIDPAGGNNVVNAGAGNDVIIGSGLAGIDNQIDGGEGIAFETLI